MHIEYIYIGLYKGIEELSLPLSQESNIHFDVTTNQIYIPEPNEKRSPYYYGGLNCSAIVGKNGVGKSTILDFIKNQIIHGGLYGAIVFRDGDYRYVYDPTSTCDFVGKEENFEYIRSKKLINKFPFIRLINLTNINNLDPSLTTNRANRSKIFIDFSPKSSIQERKQMFSRISKYLTFKNYDLDKNTGYAFKIHKASIKNILNKYKKFNPNYFSRIGREISKEYEKFLLELHHNGADTYQKTYIKMFNRIAKETSFDLSSIILLNMIPNLILSFSRYYTKNYDLASSLTLFLYINNIKKHPQPENIDFVYLSNTLVNCFKNTLELDYNNTLKKIDYNNTSNNRIGVEPVLDTVPDSVDLFLNEAIDLIYELSIDINRFKLTVDREGTIFSNDFDTTQIIADKINNRPKIISELFDIGWVGISSGEFAKIRLFSDLYHYVTSSLENKSYNSLSNIIFIDEADLYLHPEWQRTFLFELINMIKEKKGGNEYQIILTSHSPIIISDFLPNDIVSLHKDGREVTVQSALGFGTNITELFIDGMHIDSTFGELSRLTIEKILSRYNTNSLTKHDKFLISQIGNEHIRKQLSQ